jgi:6-phosphogluconolactonase (cycloisomerase 2 family)
MQLKGKIMSKSFQGKSVAVLLALSLFAAMRANAKEKEPEYAGAVFLMTNSNSGNQILRFGRKADGSLVQVGKTNTGGNGTGGTTDPLGSQNSLVLTQDAGFLLAVNAGSGTVSSFQVDGEKLRLVDVESSGGGFPNAIAQWGDLVYVLNAAGNSSVAGFHFEDGKLTRIPGAIGYLSTGLAGGSSITFTADGKVLLVAERTTGRIDSFPVNDDGTLGAATITSYPGIFDFAIAPGSELLIAVGGPTITSNAVDDNATLTNVATTNIFAGACWVVVTPTGYVYGSTGGADVINGYSLSPSGALTAIGTGEAATVPNGTPLDLALSSDGKYLYSLNSAAGTIGAWSINPSTGVLTANSPVVLPAGAATHGFNGIAAY